VQGLSNIDIADRLVIARSTVKNHVSSILTKLNVTNRTEAIAYTIQHHLID
jgi:NarL family two-component system response regulator LiaR